MDFSQSVFVLVCALNLPSILCQHENRPCFCSTLFPNVKCNFTGLYCSPHDNNCNKENIALGKEVRVSTSIFASHITAQGCMTVNGIIDTDTSYSDSWEVNPNCFLSGIGDYQPKWEVFLGRNYSISEITIYARKSNLNGMHNVIVSVDGQECYPTSNFGLGVLVRTDIVCTQIKRGSRVMVLKKSKRPFPDNNYFLSICEVQVWVCKAGLYGENCDQSCPHCKGCDNHDGTCRDGCDLGYYGTYCQFHCGHCMGSLCEQQSARCPNGCNKGWRGDLCSEACPPGFYGHNCLLTCPTICTGGEVCSRITGECSASCDVGWQGSSCNETCTSGTWGPGCKNKCGNCANGNTCDTVNGYCPMGCTEGWSTMNCTTPCKAGTYGPNCEKMCGRCEKRICDIKSGTCHGDCVSGWMSDKCTESCPPSQYGANCKLRCGKCEEDQACDKVSGTCSRGCKNGWRSSLCNEACPLGTYGKNCSEECRQCKDKKCHKENGVCQDGCNPGYKGAHCQDVVVAAADDIDNFENQLRKLPLGFLVGIVFALGGMMILIILTFVLFLLIRRYLRENEDFQSLEKSSICVVPKPLVLPKELTPDSAETLEAGGRSMPTSLEDTQTEMGLSTIDESIDESEDTMGTLSDSSFKASQESTVDIEI